ncbi:MAG: enoyl-CoA hydratase-related protein [Phycisphaerae bacterium]|nr:enoyl-CoA hydratase-related protein [Phycisphaerae bacterium]MDW8261961.1 enoyl-CoA hydratase-related protein [Phycisphaerales bacterium]
MPEVVLIERPSAEVATVIMNRPDKRNALSLELISALTDAFVELSRDRARRVIVLRGEGKAFCAGLDLEEMAKEGSAEKAATALSKLYQAMAGSPVVTLATAHGAAFGGGVGLIAASDIVVAEEGLKIGFPEVKRGLTAALITALLRRSVSDRALRELIILGLTIDAQRAAQLGIVNRVAPAAQMTDIVQEYCRQIIAAAPNAVARSKKLLDELAIRHAREDLELALKFHFEYRHEGEIREGVAAFHEKREPRWGLRDD